MYPEDKQKDDIATDIPIEQKCSDDIKTRFDHNGVTENNCEDRVEHVRTDISSSVDPEIQPSGEETSCKDLNGGILPDIVSADPVETANHLKRSAAEFHPICQAAAQREVNLAMSQLYYNFSRNFDLVPRLADGSGTCRIQVLRSVGKWSIGTKTESSILNSYIEAIHNSHRFIYIENQFFIGSNAGDGVQNSIPQALVERIIRAYESKQDFRVIVIIPLHPNGDFLDASKAKVVMHYEYATINRGINSMMEQLKKRAPNINIQSFLSFYCLRNWGVINNKVVCEQIYVHCKLLIVDDRVVIVGSANINDRSMLGLRDSEVAIRIEDTLHVESRMAGLPHTVGFLPHSLRLKLMRQHAGDAKLGEIFFPQCYYCMFHFISSDIIDILDPLSFARWREISSRNSSVFDEIEAGMSVYRCNTIQQYKKALEGYIHRSYLDPEVQMSLGEIQGVVADWPQNFFQKEDLSPTIATRALVPNELWF